MSVDKMETLLHTLSLAKNETVLKKNQDHFKELPLHEWKGELERLEASHQICDVDSLPDFVARFKVFYGEDTLKEEDFRDKYPMIRFALKDMKNPPNTL